MSIECARVGGINLSQGFSDTDLEPIIAKSAIQAIEQGNNYYTRYDGIPELRLAISEKLKSYNHISADPDKNIIVTSGSTAALFCVLYALCRPNDKVVLFEPYYGYHLNTIFAMRLEPRYVRLDPPTWTIDFDALDKQVTEDTKVIIVNTPTNPSGKVFSREEIAALCAYAKKRGIVVVTDEIYEYFLYDGAEHVSPASVPDEADNVITISGYSKTFSITGWRIGYVVAPESVAKTIGFVHDLLYVCAPAPLQAGVTAGIRHLDSKFYEGLKSSYAKKREILCGALETAGLHPYVPNGSYYTLADISRIPGATSKQKVMKLLSETGIAAVPGEAFYHDEAGNNMARFCFAKKDAILEAAAEKLKAFKG